MAKNLETTTFKCSSKGEEYFDFDDKELAKESKVKHKDAVENPDDQYKLDFSTKVTQGDEYFELDNKAKEDTEKQEEKPKKKEKKSKKKDSEDVD